MHRGYEDMGKSCKCKYELNVDTDSWGMGADFKAMIDSRSLDGYKSFGSSTLAKYPCCNFFAKLQYGFPMEIP